MTSTTPAGWYPDPDGLASLRWWDGAWWTLWESDGARLWPGTTTPARRATVDDLPALAFVRTSFLPEARRRGVLDGLALAELTRLTDQLAGEVGGPRAVPHVVPAPSGPPRAAAPWPPAVEHSRPVPAAPPRPPAAPPPAPAAPSAPPGAPSTPPAASSTPPAAVPYPVPSAPAAARTSHAGEPRPVRREPGRIARWWATSRVRLDTDLTVHGLTYLGVLLLFVGVFGLVAFAFGDVAPGLRPVAELAVAAVPFAAAWLLARSGARFVARAMVAVGALILPVMVITSTVDGATPPPDLHGAALPLGTGLACAAVAGAYVLRVRTNPGSVLGVMVAPVLWLAAGMAAVGLGRPVPHGEDVAVPGSAQVAVIALALLATTWLAHRAVGPKPAPEAVRPRVGARLADGALVAAPAGVVVTALLALLAGSAEGAPFVPALVTTLALALAVTRLLPDRAGDVLALAWFLVLVRVVTLDTATPALTGHVVLEGTALAARGPLLLATLLAGAGLLELAVRRGRTSPVHLAAVGWALAGVLLLTTAWVGWWGVAGALLVTVWAPVRRRAPSGLPGAALALDAVAVLAPVALVTGVWTLLGGSAAGLLAGALALASAPLARGLLRRGPRDQLWRAWWVGALVVTLLAAVALSAEPSTGLERWVVPAMLVLALAALAAGPLSPASTVVAATPVMWWLWAAVVAAAAWAPAAVALGYATLGLGAVLVAHLGRPDRTRLAGALAGHATGALALLTTSGRTTLAVVLGAGTLAWLVTAVHGDRGRSPVGEMLDRVPPLRGVPWLVVLAGLPTTALVALDAGGVLHLGAPTAALPLAAAALGYAAGTRARTSERLRAVLPWAAYALVLLAVVAAHRGPVSPVSVAALGALVLLAPLARGRHPLLAWTAWLALAPLAIEAGWTLVPGLRALGGDVVVTGALVGIGGLLVVGALLADRADPRAPRALPRDPRAVAPYLVGATELVLGVLAAASLPHLSVSGQRLVLAEAGRGPVAGALLLAAATLAGVVAARGGIGAVGAAAGLLAWGGVRLVLGDGYPGAWSDVLAAAVLLLGALAGSLSRLPIPRWARWDLPASLAAVLPALTALAVARPAERSGVHVVVGLLAIAVAVRLAPRRATSEVLATTGSVLVLLGAGWAGRPWVVATLAALAAGHTVLAAVREQGAWRTARQWVGAVLAGFAWLALLGAQAGASAQGRLDATALGASLLALAVVGAVLAGMIERSWCAPWCTVGSVLAAGSGLAPLVAPSGAALAVGPAQVLAWAALALAAVLAGQLGERAEPGGRARTATLDRRTTWRSVAVVPTLAALLAGLSVASAGPFARVVVLTAVGLTSALVVLRAGRRGTLPAVLLGVTALLLAVGTTLLAGGVPAVSRSVLLAVVLASGAVQVGAYGMGLRLLGARLAAPVLAWLAWWVYALDALGGVVVWYTVPLGIAMIVVVEVWRADRRARKVATRDPGLAALDLAGTGFLVVASFAAAIVESTWHALVATGIGVLVLFWALLTRVRRRLLAGATIVLAGLVVALVLPLLALVPAWQGAAAWIAVAVVGLLVVLVATFLERGRVAMRSGRARLRAATAGWE